LNHVVRVTASLNTGIEEIRSAALIRRSRRPKGESQIRAAELGLGVVERSAAALVAAVSRSDRLWKSVAADLGFVAVEQATATFVPSTHRLWQPVAPALIRRIVQHGATALQVGDDGLRDSVAAELVLGVVREVTAALAVRDRARRRGDDEIVATHEELWVKGQTPATVDLEPGIGCRSKERNSVATYLGRGVERGAARVRLRLSENSKATDQKKDGRYV